MIKFCQHCKENNICNFIGVGGYYWSYLESAETCNECGGSFENIDFPAIDLKVLTQFSKDVNFIEAMIQLRQDDILVYESRMSQFRTQAKQQEYLEQQKSNVQVHCPYCNSTEVRKITGTERAVSIIGLGLFSKKINKSFKCKNCGGTF